MICLLTGTKLCPPPPAIPTPIDSIFGPILFLIHFFCCFSFRFLKIMLLFSKAGVPLTDYIGIGGSTVYGICSDYFSSNPFSPSVKSHIGNRKLSPIVGSKSDMADYRRLPPIIIFPRRKFSHCLIFHPIFHPTLQSVRQWDAGLSFLQQGAPPPPLRESRKMFFRKSQEKSGKTVTVREN